jgi:hypothetical protein
LDIDWGHIISGGIELAPLRTILKLDGIKIEEDEASHIAKITAKNGEILELNTETGEVSGKGTYKCIVKDDIMIEPSFFDLIGGIKVEDSYRTSTFVVTTDKVTYGDIVPFDFGEIAYEKTYENGSTKITPYRLNGAMGLPNKDNLPVVIFIHGAHIGPAEPDVSRVDLGYSYLMKELVKNGFATFTLNMNIVYSAEGGGADGKERGTEVINKYLNKIIDANLGKDDNFPLSLKGKLDLNNVILVGHSRGGGNVFIFPTIMKDKGVKVIGTFSHGPTDSITISEYPDIPAAITVPELDGDVFDLWGEVVFDKLKYLKDRKSDTYLAYVYGGNHNSFNEAIIRQDNVRGGMNPIEKEQAGEKEIMATTEQRSLYTKYVMDFVKAVMNDGNLHSLPQSLDGDFYGKQALISYTDGKGKTLLEAKNDTLNATGSVKVKKVIASNFKEVNTLKGYMRIPLINDQDMNLFQIIWETPGAVSFDLSKEKTDFSDYKSLNLYMAQDSADELNKKSDQTMTVVLTDTAGKTAKITLPKGTAALTWQAGVLMKLPDWEGNLTEIEYSENTPLSSAIIPLDTFKNINLKAIKSISLEFVDSGSIVINSISLTK